MNLTKRFILWAARDRSPCGWVPVVSFATGKRGFRRFAPFWPDEFIDRDHFHHHRPPWWRPFNMLLHWWNPQPGYSEEFHDHPRWSITIVLRGWIIEETPWRVRSLRPGAIVIRSRKYIHRFHVVKGYAGRTWTLFIVGRRDWAQNTYAIRSFAGDEGQVRK